MKKYIFILIITFSSTVYSQIINIIDDNGITVQGAYYKDVNNLLNQFEGTYVFQNNNTNLKIVLEKRENQNNGLYSEDLIVGGYQYSYNNQILINTLLNLSSNSPYNYDYKIYGNNILNNNHFPICQECVINEKRLRLSFSDPIRKIYGNLIIRKVNINGQNAIKIKLYGANNKYYVANTNPLADDFIIPSGEYILIQQ